MIRDMKKVVFWKFVLKSTQNCVLGLKVYTFVVESTNFAFRSLLVYDIRNMIFLEIRIVKCTKNGAFFVKVTDFVE